MRLIVTQTKRRSIVAVATAALLVAVIGLSLSGTDRLTNEASALPGGEFARFDGGEVSFEDYTGTPLVVNFWASWCPACVNELPEFQAVHEQVGDEVTFVGFANADRRADAVALADEVGLTYTLADDPEGSLFRSLELIAMPTTLFISADGEIEEAFAGQLTEAALLERVDRLRGRS
jgi:cytochrome c biogenesis protein CcmG/thiol:disulfide interchange protein DsbE